MVANNNTNDNFHSTITQLNIYPVKSCRGVSVKSTTLTKTGLKYDRRWIPEWLAAHAEKATVTIFGAATGAYVFSEPCMNRVFRNFFDGKETRLVMKDTAVPRVCLDNGSPGVMGRVVSVGFPDVLPVLIASETSLAELNGRLEERGHPPITFQRFRPNIVIAGGDPWSEDDWKTVRVNGGASATSWLSTLSAGYVGANSGALDIDIAARCPRCLVPNVDPVTAAKSKHEPWDTLMKFRRVDEGEKYKPCVGMLGCPRNEGKIEVGMRFDVLATTKDHKYLKIR
ncbi:hypothetical protein DV738_g4482, partial [Chaetothyriales sp. CBS 135597]